MTERAVGLDYRIAERFILGRETLRNQILDIPGKYVRPDDIEAIILNQKNLLSTEFPPHLRQIALTLKKIPALRKEQWFDEACRKLEVIYSRSNIALSD